MENTAVSKEASKRERLVLFLSYSLNNNNPFKGQIENTPIEELIKQKENVTKYEKMGFIPYYKLDPDVQENIRMNKRLIRNNFKFKDMFSFLQSVKEKVNNDSLLPVINSLLMNYLSKNNDYIDYIDNKGLEMARDIMKKFNYEIGHIFLLKILAIPHKSESNLLVRQRCQNALNMDLSGINLPESFFDKRVLSDVLVIEDQSKSADTLSEMGVKFLYEIYKLNGYDTKIIKELNFQKKMLLKTCVEHELRLDTFRTFLVNLLTDIMDLNIYDRKESVAPITRQTIVKLFDINKDIDLSKGVHLLKQIKKEFPTLKLTIMSIWNVLMPEKFLEKNYNLFLKINDEYNNRSNASKLVDSKFLNSIFEYDKELNKPQIDQIFKINQNILYVLKDNTYADEKLIKDIYHDFYTVSLNNYNLQKYKVDYAQILNDLKERKNGPKLVIPKAKPKETDDDFFYFKKYLTKESAIYDSLKSESSKKESDNYKDTTDETGYTDTIAFSNDTYESNQVEPPKQEIIEINEVETPDINPNLSITSERLKSDSFISNNSVIVMGKPYKPLTKSRRIIRGVFRHFQIYFDIFTGLFAVLIIIAALVLIFN